MNVSYLLRFKDDVRGRWYWWILMMMVLGSGVAAVRPTGHSIVRTLETLPQLIDILGAGSGGDARSDEETSTSSPRLVPCSAILFGWAWDDRTNQWKETLEQAVADVALAQVAYQLGVLDVAYYPLESVESLAMANLLGLHEFPVIHLYHHRLERRSPGSGVPPPATSYPRAYSKNRPVPGSNALAIWLLENIPTRVVDPVGLHLQRYVAEHTPTGERATLSSGGALRNLAPRVMVFFTVASTKSPRVHTMVSRVAQNIIAAHMFPSLVFQRCDEVDPALLDRAVDPDANVVVVLQPLGGEGVGEEEVKSQKSFLLLDAFRFQTWSQPMPLVERLRQFYSPSIQTAWRDLERTEFERRRGLIAQYLKYVPFKEISSYDEYQKEIAQRNGFAVIGIIKKENGRKAFAAFLREVIAAGPRVPVQYYLVDGNRHPRFQRFLHSGGEYDSVLVTLLPVQYQASTRHAIRSLSVPSWEHVDAALYASKLFTNDGLRLLEQHPPPLAFTPKTSSSPSESKEEEEEEKAEGKPMEDMFLVKPTHTDDPDEEPFALVPTDLVSHESPQPRTRKQRDRSSSPSTGSHKGKKATAEKELKEREALEEKKRKKQERIQEKQRKVEAEREAAKQETQRKLERQKRREEKNKKHEGTKANKKEGKRTTIDKKEGGPKGKGSSQKLNQNRNNNNTSAKQKQHKDEL